MKVKRKYPFYYYKDFRCDECEGNGFVEYFVGCNVPQSDCCGGCYDTKRCDKCDGAGFTTIEKTLQELIYKYKKNRKYV